MFGLGTIINFGAIIVGGIVGLLCGKKLPEKLRETLINGMGAVVIIIGITGVIEKMMTAYGGTLDIKTSVMLITSLALGTVIGELIGIEHGIEKFGVWLKTKTKSETDGGFVDGFLTASITVCVGAMAIVGSIEDGISGNISILLSKSIIDAITIMILTASKGKGCIFSAFPVLIFQGIFTLIAHFAGGFMSDGALNNLSFVGSVLIMLVGLNLIRDKKIRVANMLPSIVPAALWSLIPW